MNFERKEWKKGDPHPGATDLNRIENGIEQALASGSLDLTALKAIEPLQTGAKAADLVVAYNALLRALQGAAPAVATEVTAGANANEGDPEGGQDDNSGTE